MVNYRIVTLALASLVSTTAAAQERVYVSQRSPARVHAFSFSAGAWTREDASPADPAAQALQLGMDPFYGLAATNHFMVAAVAGAGLSVDVVDPFTNVELPRVTTSHLGGAITLSVDQQFAYLGGQTSTQLPSLSVVDLDPSRATFLTESGVLVGADIGTGVVSGPVALVGSTLYMSLLDPNGTFGFAPKVKIVAIDVSSPTAPFKIGETVVTQTLGFMQSDQAVTALRAFSLGGTTYLFLCRIDLVVLEPSGGGTLIQRAEIKSSRATAPAGFRFMRDVYATDSGGTRRAFVITDVAGPSGTLGDAEEVLELNIDNFSSPVLTSFKTLATPGSEDVDRVQPSLDGTRLYVLSRGGVGSFSEVGELHALDITGGLAASTAFSTPIDGSTQESTGFVVRTALSPAPSGAVSSVSVSGATPANVLINDVSRTLSIDGSGLADTTHVFVGLDRLPAVSTTDLNVTATSPPLLPAGDRPVVLVSSTGGISRFGSPSAGALAVVSAATSQPPEIVYAPALSETRVAVLHAAAETQVVSSFDTAGSPTYGLVTPDGALLFVSEFLGARIEVFSLLNDQSPGWTLHKKVASLHVGGFPTTMVMKRDGSRLYVTTIDGYVAAIDSGKRPPELIDVDDLPGTTDPFIDIALSPGLSRIKVAMFDAFGNPDSGTRGLTLSADDQWLYVGRSRNPHIAAVHVDDDLVPASDTTFYSIPTPPPNGQRVDGLVVRGSRLYFTSAGDNPPKVRLFDVSGASIAPATPSSLAFPAGAAAGTRTLALAPDGKFIYASSRTQGTDVEKSTVHILDAVADTWVAKLGLGTFSGPPSVSPTSQFAYVGSAERDAVFTIDARPGPGQHTVIGVTGGGLGTAGTAVNPGQLTPPGAGVGVSPAPNVDLTFSTVGSAGSTTVTSLNVTPVTMPEGFSVLNVVGNPVYYEVKTTAGFTPPVKVCLTYTDAQVMGVDESTLRLMHEESGSFVDRTIGGPDTDPSANRICGSVTSFSQFAIGIRSGDRTLCSVLGRAEHPRSRDVDSFEFQGASGERVILGIAQNPDPSNRGDTVKLVLHDKIKGQKLIERDMGPLPLSTEATLPASGRYVVRIVRKGGSHGFHGSYCLTLESSGNAFATFAATANVEP